MKNLGEGDLFDVLGNRLKNYTEIPSVDIWGKISKRIVAPSAPGWALATNSLAGIAATAMVIMLFIFKPSEPKIEPEQSVQVKPLAQNKNSVDNAAKPNSEGNNTITQSQMTRPDPNLNKKLNSHVNVNDLSKSIVQGSRDQTKNDNPAFWDKINDDPRSQQIIAKLGTGVSVEDENQALSDSTLALANKPNDSIADNVSNPIRRYKRKIRKLSFYSVLNPSLSFQEITPSQNNNTIINGLISPTIFSSERFGIAVEAGLQYRVSKKWELFGGLSYYQQNQTITYQYQYQYQYQSTPTASNSGDQNSVTLVPSEQSKDVQYTMKNIGGQAGFLYEIKRGKLSHKIGGGLSFQHGLLKISSGGSYDNSKSNYVYYQVLYRVEYSLNRACKFFVQPNFSHAFISSEKISEPFSNKPFHVGVGLGLLFSF